MGFDAFVERSARELQATGGPAADERQEPCGSARRRLVFVEARDWLRGLLSGEPKKQARPRRSLARDRAP
jgi:hypothetical protein